MGLFYCRTDACFLPVAAEFSTQQLANAPPTRHLRFRHRIGYKILFKSVCVFGMSENLPGNTWTVTKPLKAEGQVLFLEKATELRAGPSK